MNFSDLALSINDRLSARDEDEHALDVIGDVLEEHGVSSETIREFHQPWRHPSLRDGGIVVTHTHNSNVYLDNIHFVVAIAENGEAVVMPPQRPVFLALLCNGINVF